jgi:hypothetical protein
MESQFGKAASSFVATSLDFLLGRLAQVLAMPETERLLGRLRAEGAAAGLRLRTADLWLLLDGVDVDEVLAVIPGLVAHNLARPEIREILLAEARAALDVEGERTLAEVLEPAAVAVWRDRCVEVAGPLLAELARTEAFARWVAGDQHR